LIWKNVAELHRRASYVKWDSLTKTERNSMAVHMFDLAAKYTVATHRRRTVVGLCSIPVKLHDRFQTLFGLPKEEPEPEAVIAPPVPVLPPPKPITWTDQEEAALLIHTAHLLKKQGMAKVPDPKDHVGCIFLSDAIKLGQENALPTHRRKQMSHPRMVLDTLGMMSRLDGFLRMRFLPALPTRAPELPKPAPVTGSNGSHSNGCNGHHPAPTSLTGISPCCRAEVSVHAGKEGTQFYYCRKCDKPCDPVEPGALPALPPPVVAVPVASPIRVPVVNEQPQVSDAALVQGLAVRLLHALESTQRQERRIAELEEFNQLRLEETDLLSGKLKAAELAIAELRESVAELSNAEKKHKPRVAIIGCRKDEFDEVLKLAHEHGLDLAFKLYEQDAKPTRIFADYAISMKWVSHAWEQQVRDSGIPRGQYSFITGGAGKVVMQLEVWFSEVPA
jgi:hypothetical protein